MSEAHKGAPAIRVDLGSERVWCGRSELKLSPKAFHVLRYLVERAGELVTKTALLEAVWPDVHVSEAAVTVCIREIRQALGDRSRAPRYIETVHRRGFRFIGAVQGVTTVSHPQAEVDNVLAPTTDDARTLSTVVGREDEVARLHYWFERARQGERQLVFVTGEPGIGKTTLVDVFLRELQAHEPVWIGRGQCIEHYGSGEAYLPILEALGRLDQELGGNQLVAALRRYAPMWLVQLPALVEDGELATLHQKLLGASRERMLREMGDAIVALTAERTGVLILEDLHWNDLATLELLSYVANRRETARLMVIGTYRPVELIVRDHPLKGLKQELQLRGHGHELPLTYLTEGEVAQYLEKRLHPQSFQPDFIRSLHQLTGGNPLFMVNVTAYWMTQGIVTEQAGKWVFKPPESPPGTRASMWMQLGIPDSLRLMVEKQFEDLSRDDQHLLEAASVAGVTFSAALVAAGLDRDILEVEERCESLARRRHFLESRCAVEWPDGTLTSSYCFHHAFYQEVLYARLPPGRLTQLHQRIGVRQEAGYGDRTRDIATELAMHFERGRDHHRAVIYHQFAAETAIHRYTAQEAIAHLMIGLEQLQALPETPARNQDELSLQLALGAQLVNAKGYAAADVEQTYRRAQELFEQSRDAVQHFPILRGLWRFHNGRGDYRAARELGELLLFLAQGDADPVRLAVSRDILATTSWFQGEFDTARHHAQHGLAVYDPHWDQTVTLFAGGLDPGMSCLMFMSWILWIVGYPDQALQYHRDALRLAQVQAQPYNLALILVL